MIEEWPFHIYTHLYIYVYIKNINVPSTSDATIKMLNKQ